VRLVRLADAMSNESVAIFHDCFSCDIISSPVIVESEPPSPIGLNSILPGYAPSIRFSSNMFHEKGLLRTCGWTSMEGSKEYTLQPSAAIVSSKDQSLEMPNENTEHGVPTALGCSKPPLAHIVHSPSIISPTE
jgi:hypothetical protein